MVCIEYSFLIDKREDLIVTFNNIDICIINFDISTSNDNILFTKDIGNTIELINNNKSTDDGKFISNNFEPNPLVKMCCKLLLKAKINDMKNSDVKYCIYNDHIRCIIVPLKQIKIKIEIE